MPVELLFDRHFLLTQCSNKGILVSKQLFFIRHQNGFDIILFPA